MMPGRSGSSAPYADPAAQISTLPRAPDALAIFAATATLGQQGSVGGETARVTRAYNAASGRECREILLGYGANERSAVACRNDDGSYVSARPLLRGSLR
ncbi:MAG: hypothetical protein JWR10_2229 [Rubritepida sp.]|nr:hypothetical protein [Rubritepida sp.]